MFADLAREVDRYIRATLRYPHGPNTGAHIFIDVLGIGHGDHKMPLAPARRAAKLCVVYPCLPRRASRRLRLGQWSWLQVRLAAHSFSHILPPSFRFYVLPPAALDLCRAWRTMDKRTEHTFFPRKRDIGGSLSRGNGVAACSSVVRRP